MPGKDEHCHFMPILIRWDTGHWMVQEDKLNWLNGRDNRAAFKKFKLKFVKFCTGRQDSHIHFHHRNTGRMDDWIPSISRVTLLSLLPVLLLLLILCLPPPLPPQLRAVKTILPESDPLSLLMICCCTFAYSCLNQQVQFGFEIHTSLFDYRF